MKDVIYVEHKNFISVKGHSLSFKNLINKTIKYIPIEDISMVIFDNIDSYFSNQVVNVCVNNDIGMIFCGINHSPIADISSTYCHRKKLESIKSQLTVSYKTKQRLWKKLFLQKLLIKVNV